MKYSFCFVLLFFFICKYSMAETFQLADFHTGYDDYQNMNLIEELNYAENKILQGREHKESLVEKLEKLEIILFGAIQSGDFGYRVGNVYRNADRCYNNISRLNKLAGRRSFSPYSWHNYYPNYRYLPNNFTYSPKRYNYSFPQIMPQHFSLGTKVKIID